MLELGINVLSWEREKIRERVTYAVNEVASKNPQKKIFVISPLYCNDDFEGEGNAQKWRDEISDIVKTLNFENVTYIDGTDLIGEMSLISADLIHPNIYGIIKVADNLTEIIKHNI